MSELNNPAAAEEKLHLLHYGQVKDFFIDSDQPEYAKCVQDVERNLAAIEDAARRDVPQYLTVRLPLRPPQAVPHGLYEQKSRQAKEASDGQRLYYNGEIPEPTQELLLMTELLTHSRVVDDRRDKDNHGGVLSRGYYDDIKVYFVETYGQDSLGEYMTWSATNLMPKSFIAQLPQTESAPFLTTGDRNQLSDDVFDSLNQLDTAPIDEAQIVQSWIHRQAA